jgi:hypothetical protein
MKHRITIRLIAFCALAFGIARFASPETAQASPNQVHIGVGIGLAPHHHHRRHHRRAVVIAPRVIEHHDNGNHYGERKHEDHGNDRH